jgi:hypothetical protein
VAPGEKTVPEIPIPQKPDSGPALEPTHRDFGLRVEMLDAAPGTEGSARHLVEGRHVRFRIGVERDAYVGIWDVGPGGTIVQLFPNKYEPDNLVPAGKPRDVPGISRYHIDAELSEGTNRVWIVASTRPWDALKGEEEGPYTIFKTPEQKQAWERRLREIRGLRVRPADVEEPAGVSEEMLHYQVVPALKTGGL